MNRLLAWCFLVWAALGQTVHAQPAWDVGYFQRTCTVGELADNGAAATGPVHEFAFPDFPFTFQIERARCTLDASQSFIRVGLAWTASPFEKRPKVTVIQDGVEKGFFGFALIDAGHTTGSGFTWEYCNFDCSNIYGSGIAALKPWNDVRFSPQRAFRLVAKMQDDRTVTMDIPAAPARAVPPLAAQVRGLWWSPAESGWGLLMERSLDGIVFANWYTFDANGEPTWFVMPNGQAVEPNVVEGDVYWPQGPAAFTAYDAAKFSPGAPVGRFRIEFFSNTVATFRFDVQGHRGVKSIVPMQFRVGRFDMECAGHRGAWWNPATPGIGFGFEGSLDTSVYLSQVSHCPMHAVWSTYNAEGRPTWYFSGLTESDPNRPLPYPPDRGDKYAGPLYKVRGSYFGGPYQASQVAIGAPLGEWRLVRGPGAGQLVPIITTPAGSYQSVLQRFDY